MCIYIKRGINSVLVEYCCVGSKKQDDVDSGTWQDPVLERKEKALDEQLPRGCIISGRPSLEL